MWSWSRRPILVSNLQIYMKFFGHTEKIVFCVNFLGQKRKLIKKGKAKKIIKKEQNKIRDLKNQGDPFTLSVWYH